MHLALPSPATATDDCTQKLDVRRSPPRVEAVLPVAQDQRRATIHLRQAAGWWLRDREGGDRTDQPSLGTSLTLEAI